MNTPAQSQLVRLTLPTLLLSAAATAQTVAPGKLTILGTPEQCEVETEAIEIFNSPVVGSFTISIDSAPANGRVNHLQTSPQAKVLLIRNTFNDWGVQNPQAASIKRIDGPAAAVHTREQVINRAVELIQAGTQTILGWETKGFAAQAAPNTIGGALPVGFGAVNRSQRQAQRAARAQDYAHRYAAVAADPERFAEAK